MFPEQPPDIKTTQRKQRTQKELYELMLPLKSIKIK